MVDYLTTENFRLILFLLIFLSMSLAMFFRKIPALLALPFMAMLIPLAGGVDFSDTIRFVIGEGSTKLHNAYTVALFGSMLSVFLQKTGVAESLIKKGAELAGDNPWTISVLTLLLISVLFTTLGGLGAIIMVATIVLPIMSSIGTGPLTVIGIFLLGLSMGGIMNAGNWAVYVDVMGLSIDQIRPFAMLMYGITFLIALIYISIQLYRDGHDLNLKRILLTAVSIFVLTGVLYMLYLTLTSEGKEVFHEFIGKFYKIFKWTVFSGIIIMLTLSVLHALRNYLKKTEKVFWPAYFTPLIPLLLILMFDVNFIAAFICGLMYGFITTYRAGSLNTLVRSILEGGGLVMPAVVLMLGIGMLLNAIMGPAQEWPGGWPVLNTLKPLLTDIVPNNRMSYILIFGLLTPLALYRGPLNVWGMGYGLAAVFLASGMNPASIMGLLLSVGQVQGISDPTNTHNVWLANEMQQNVQKVLWNTIPYSWIIAFIGLVASAWMYF